MTRKSKIIVRALMQNFYVKHTLHSAYLLCIIKLWLIAVAVGLLALICDIVFKDMLTKTAGGVLCGVGSGLMGIGMAKFAISRMEEKNPKQMKQNEIESKDERNVMIRHKAQALSGLVLQWCILAVAWVCIITDGPLWITLTALGVFLGKIFLEIGLMAYYQNRM